MIDIILDSDFFVEFLTQYFHPNIMNHGTGQFQLSPVFSRELVRRLNQIVYMAYEGISNLVIASTFSLIEISRKWDTLVQERFSTQQLHAFVYQYPEWFSLAPVDDDLLPFFVDVPANVIVDAKLQPIEWTDAVHIATMLSRGDNATMATNDSRIKRVLELQGRMLL